METRNALRIPVDLEVLWKVEKKNNQVFSLATKDLHKNKAVDISALGMGIITKYFLPHGLIIKIALKGHIFGIDRFIRLKGEIRYCNYIKQGNYKCGIKFINPPESYISKFNDFIVTYNKRKDPRIFLSK